MTPNSFPPTYATVENLELSIGTLLFSCALLRAAQVKQLHNGRSRETHTTTSCNIQIATNFKTMIHYPKAIEIEVRFGVNACLAMCRSFIFSASPCMVVSELHVLLLLLLFLYFSPSVCVCLSQSLSVSSFKQTQLNRISSFFFFLSHQLFFFVPSLTASFSCSNFHINCQQRKAKKEVEN